MADELVKVGIVAEDKTGPGVASAKRNLEGLGKSAVTAAGGFTKMEKAIVGVGAAAVGLTAAAGFGVIKMAQGALQSYAAYERLGQSINALTAKQALLSGSATTMTQALAQTKTQSKELLDWIQKLAIESPFRQDDVAQAFRLSMALGFNTKEAQRLTQAMLNFATATGSGGETIERVNRALGQMKTKGKVSLEEINQLTEGGVDAMRILQNATGKTGEALYKDISKGAISADFAIEAIIADTEKLYAGAGKNSATGMAGMLSSLQEMQDIVGRELFTGMFEQLAGPMAALTTIVTAPEFKAGLESWSATLGDFTGDQIEAAAGAMERVNTAVQPLLAAGAPAWLTVLQTVMAAGDQTLGITITPSVTKIQTPDGGLNVEVKPWGTTVTNKDGGLLDVNLKGKVITIDPNTNDDVPPLKLVADWKEGTIGSAIAAFQAKTQEEQNRILVNAGWKGDALTTLQTLIDATQLWAKVNPVFVLAKTATDATLGLWALAQGLFTGKPVDVETMAEDNSLLAMWNTVQQAFANNPITVAVQGTPVNVESARAIIANNTDMLLSSPDTRQGVGFLRSNSVGQNGYVNSRAPIFNGWNSPATSSTGGPTPRRKRAIGDGFFGGGLALVGEAGPELAVLPRGTAIYSNRDTRALGIPGFAAGTTQLPPGAGPFIALLRAAGLWKSTGGGGGMGPQTEAQALGWRDFTQQGTQAMQTAADRTGAAFEETAAKVNKTFESALQGVPGLFGTSHVTAEDMRKSQLGIYQPKADEYLRQLSDEVLNGKDWGAGVDIKDAAKRAGIDPNLPNDIILELVKEAWNNSSLFAEGKNLDLINTDAVKAAIEQQQKELSGQASLKAMFGITDENLQQQSEALGQGLAAVFGGASETDAVKASGTALMAGITAGLSDPGAASTAVAGMADAMKTAQGTPEAQTALYDNGYGAYGAWSKGWAAAAAAAPITPPGGGTTPPGTTPPGKAVGVGYWQGGWMQVHANETLYAPRGTTVRNARESARDGRGVVNNFNTTIIRQVDEEAFMAKVVRRIRRAS